MVRPTVFPLLIAICLVNANPLQLEDDGNPELIPNEENWSESAISITSTETNFDSDHVNVSYMLDENDDTSLSEDSTSSSMSIDITEESNSSSVPDFDLIRSENQNELLEIDSNTTSIIVTKQSTEGINTIEGTFTTEKSTTIDPETVSIGEQLEINSTLLDNNWETISSVITTSFNQLSSTEFLNLSSTTESPSVFDDITSDSHQTTISNRSILIVDDVSTTVSLDNETIQPKEQTTISYDHNELIETSTFKNLIEVTSSTSPENFTTNGHEIKIIKFSTLSALTEMLSDDPKKKETQLIGDDDQMVLSAEETNNDIMQSSFHSISNSRTNKLESLSMVSGHSGSQFRVNTISLFVQVASIVILVINFYICPVRNI
ncbi:hypothetical protein RDWZM_005568 [Blomia tropicalis]|uniref:Uncharacterized protein n=1 Tax=Blomia tropicalis TaxID=40697 RepID=A0A9Q0RMI4_BLOTA|nr:hypothetical protein RDWZM_005568 [Blomia tropicalis]